MQIWPLCFILGRIVTHASHADSALVDYAGSARAPLTDHSRVDAGASRCSHSTAVMPATCSGSMHQNAGASVSHSTHLVSRTLKCARDMSHFSQEEMQLARARCGRRVIARARQSQHEPGACADSNRGHRPRRPGRSDGRDDFTRRGRHLSPVSVNHGDSFSYELTVP